MPEKTADVVARARELVELMTALHDRAARPTLAGSTEIYTSQVPSALLLRARAAAGSLGLALDRLGE